MRNNHLMYNLFIYNEKCANGTNTQKIAEQHFSLHRAQTLQHLHERVTLKADVVER